MKTCSMKQGRIQYFGLEGIWQGVWGLLWGRKSPSGVRGRAPVGVWGQKTEECYVIRLEKTRGEKKRVHTH